MGAVAGTSRRLSTRRGSSPRACSNGWQRYAACDLKNSVQAAVCLLDMGLPVVRGSARNGSKTDLFLGNGNSLELG
jgi:hypothetical protein